MNRDVVTVATGLRERELAMEFVKTDSKTGRTTEKPAKSAEMKHSSFLFIQAFMGVTSIYEEEMPS